jgi:hypothetical protein
LFAVSTIVSSAHRSPSDVSLCLSCHPRRAVQVGDVIVELNGAPLGPGVTDGELAAALQRLGRPVTLGFVAAARATRPPGARSSRVAFAGAGRAGRDAAAADTSSDEEETTVAAVALGDDRYGWIVEFARVGVQRVSWV